MRRFCRDSSRNPALLITPDKGNSSAEATRLQLWNRPTMHTACLTKVHGLVYWITVRSREVVRVWPGQVVVLAVIDAVGICS